MRYTTVGQPGNRGRDLVLAGSLAVFALLMAASLPPSAELTVNRVLRTTLLRPFIAMHEVFEQRTDLAGRVGGLVHQRDSLALESLAMADLSDENRQLRALLGMSRRETGDFFVAEIIPGHTPLGEPSGFLLRTSSGLRFAPPLGVATPAGLVGVVRTVRGRTGLGEYWTHPEFRVAVVTTDGQESGIIRPFVTADGEQLMLLEGIPFQTDLVDGTRLVTSGVGGIYPRGLAVGVVLAEHEAQFGWTHSFLVEPAVRPGTETLIVGWRPGALADSLVALPAPDTAAP